MKPSGVKTNPDPWPPSGEGDRRRRPPLFLPARLRERTVRRTTDGLTDSATRHGS
jgi:hypothetical protein